MDLLRDGNHKAMKFGGYMLCIIIALGIYNFFVKIYLDPCCQEHTTGEFLFRISNFFSYLIAGGILILIIFVFLKFIFNKIKPQGKVSWKAEKESVLNATFIIILIINFCFLLAAQLPKFLIGCTGCDATPIEEDIRRYLPHE
ncbi:MAG: hypothetical protein U9O66_01395 [Patescibacteria group bacterium]|nr:hypothetical protein [Patescibacteria group bacterium]